MDDSAQNPVVPTPQPQADVVSAPIAPTVPPVDPMDNPQVPDLPLTPVADPATPAPAAAQAMQQMANAMSPVDPQPQVAPLIDPMPAAQPDPVIAQPQPGVDSTPVQSAPTVDSAPLGPVTMEDLMEELQHIEDKLDEMDEKL